MTREKKERKSSLPQNPGHRKELKKTIIAIKFFVKSMPNWVKTKNMRTSRPTNKCLSVTHVKIMLMYGDSTSMLICILYHGVYMHDRPGWWFALVRCQGRDWSRPVTIFNIFKGTPTLNYSTVHTYPYSFVRSEWWHKQLKACFW
jgi:hypothetical protein